ncbi:hypothetical protein AAEX28_02330 [Lentisphaerota bacterium WC36G]|nr:hypothetical protein LJT99_05215 [Lentisphaerae bacterium WC36]
MSILILENTEVRDAVINYKSLETWVKINNKNSTVNDLDELFARKKSIKRST